MAIAILAEDNEWWLELGWPAAGFTDTEFRCHD
jgi:hypothetical protein